MQAAPKRADRGALRAKTAGGLATFGNCSGKVALPAAREGTSGRSEILHQPQGVVDRRVGIACRNRIADAEKLERAAGLAASAAAGHESVVIDGAQVTRSGFRAK